jgi:RHS repeat-associated protein
MRTPPVLTGPQPELTLGYSSSSVDGRMAASNNQPSWLGEGFEFTPGGFIERRYKMCKKDGGNGAGAGTGSGDLCWKTENATLFLNGQSTELLKDSGGLWHGRSEDGSRIERRTGASNGDNDGEHWVVTTVDGTQYWFGRNRLPGWTANLPETKSAWTVPVYGNQAGEPCDSTDWCQQAWRWNLDYVVDPFGNTMSYWYATESNRYARNMSSSTLADYTRGGYLTRIDYGTRSSTAYGTAPYQVVLATADRCLASCTTHDAAHWPDVPWDQQCTASPCFTGSPTFWTTKRLSKVATRVWTGSGTTYREAEAWTFTHSFPNPGDGTRAGLWLDRISHTGGTATIPDISFVGTQLPNRVDATDLSPAMNWWRIAHINTESGGRIAVSYSAQDCVRGSRMPSAPESNTLRCYPVRWQPEGNQNPITDYFHRYVVTQVTETDLALPSEGRSPRATTAYEYVGAPAWHYSDDDGLIDEEDKTWSVWRGYARVRVTRGDPGEQSRTETLYFRGMHGDKLPTGTRSVSVQASEGAAVPDEDVYAGLPREEITYNGPGGAMVDATIHDPWQSAPTASRTIKGVTTHARFVDSGAAHTRTALDGGRGWRRSTSTSTYDASGQKVKEEDLGDTGVSGDERCTLTTFARNTSAWLLSYPSRVQVFGVDCARAAAGGLTETDIVSDEYTSYDQQARGAAPTKGAVSRTEVIKALPGTYLTTTRAEHDAAGRVIRSWDVRGNLATTAYHQPGGGPVTGTTSTNHLGWVTTTTLDPAWNAPLSVVDPNGERTDLTYDGVGRLTGVWLPGRDKAAGHTASVTYAYTVRANGPSVSSTSKLNPLGGYATTHVLHDGLMRPRQVQAPEGGTTGGRIITDTLYDSAGRPAKTNDGYVADGAPGTNLFLPLPDAQVPAQARTAYDGAGRTIASIFLVNGAEKWRTSTAYGGDRVDVTPPDGGTPMSTVLDARGQTTALRQYAAGTPTGSFDQTTYRYNARGDLSRVTDPGGNVWDFGYDLLGHRTRTADPDKGVAVNVYNDAGDLISSTDARGRVLAYGYDSLGRKTSLRDGGPTGPKRAEWTYDTLASGTPVRGQPVRSTRWIGTDAYVNEITGYNDRYQPTGQTISIPATAAMTGVSGSYSYTYSYKVDGSPATTRLPAVGNVAAETLVHGYNALGMPTTLSTNLSSTGDDTFYVNGTSYTRFGELGVIGRRYDNGKYVDTAAYYEVGTRRINRLLTVRETSPSVVTDLNYAYDPAGSVTRIADGADTQCFRYDRLRRLTEAWTPGGGDCAAAPAQAGLGGPAPYWQSFTYDRLGNRRTSVDRTPTGSTSRTYNYPAPGAPRPHAVTSVQTGAATATYTYDATGNSETRPAGTGTQTLSWDSEGRLAAGTDPTGTTSYVYDADGNRLVRTDPTGKTLYLPGQELRYTASGGAKTGTRYYTHAEQVIGMRTGTGVTWLVNDHHGTGQASVAAATQAITIRRQKPFGEPRGPAPAWPNDKGFVGGTNDNTGLTHLGAREYDPGLGQFISVDPMIDQNDPQQLNPYAYSNSNPATFSDPDGLCFACVIRRIADALKKIVAEMKRAARGCRGSKCQAKAPWGVKRTKTYKHGTVLTVFNNKRVAINGYLLPIGDYDPDLVAEVADERRGKLLATHGSAAKGWHAVAETMNLVKDACFALVAEGACDMETRNQIEEQVAMMRSQLSMTNMLCAEVSVGNTTGNLCLGHDRKGFLVTTGVAYGRNYDPPLHGDGTIKVTQSPRNKYGEEGSFNCSTKATVTASRRNFMVEAGTGGDVSIGATTDRGGFNAFAGVECELVLHRFG